MKNKIRKAKKEDIPVVVGLWKELKEYHVRINTKEDSFFYKHKKSAADIWKIFLEKNISHKKSLVLVAYQDNKLIAYTISIIKENIPIFNIGRYGQITDLYVKKEYRGQGIGKELINQSKKFFKTNKLKFMELTVSHNNHQSIKFYQKYGFKESLKRMRVKI
tara:strand:+ start:136 stop:621 length:486 start_codon:yes stop_codon:yes gene_type:complete